MEVDYEGVVAWKGERKEREREARLGLLPSVSTQSNPLETARASTVASPKTQVPRRARDRMQPKSAKRPGER